MAASSRGGQALSSLIRGSMSTTRACSRCLAQGSSRRGRLEPALQQKQLQQQQRLYSASAAAEAAPSPDANQQPPAPVPAAPALYRIKSGIILTRPPLLTRFPTGFEKAFYLYQKRLEERLAAPFYSGMFFREGTPSDLDWKKKYAERGFMAAKDIGFYRPRRRDHRYRDEVLVGSRLGDPAVVREVLLKDAEVRITEDGEEIPPEEVVPVERPQPRRSEADAKADARALDRAMDQTLYLVVKGKSGAWEFPVGDVLTSENLHETAARVLASAAGVNMNTWIVGRVPVSHLVYQPVIKADSTVEKKGEKVFFLKGRIMAGQADLTNNTMGLTDFQWLTKPELEKVLDRTYFQGIKNMMDPR